MPAPVSSGSSPLPSPSSTPSASEAASPARSRVTSSAPSKRLDVEEIEALLSEIPPEFLKAKDFNPFSHYDDSVEELQGYHDIVREAIDLIVDVHHKGFNSATAAFTHVVESFSQSQSTVASLLSTLTESKRLLTARSEHLKEYWTQTATLTAINATLSKMAYIQTVPAHLATLTSHKLYLHSVLLLTHTLTTMSDDDLRDVEGLLQLREDLLALKNSVVDQLMDDLHTALYDPAAKERDANAAAADKDDAREESGDHVVSRVGKADLPSSTRERRQSGSAAMQTGGGGNLVDFSASRKDAPASATASASASAASPSSPAATLAFLSSSSFSPFAPPSTYVVDPAASLPQESAVFSDPTYRSLSHLLHEERSPASLAHPLSSTSRFIALLVAALDHLNALPTAKTQITRRVPCGGHRHHRPRQGRHSRQAEDALRQTTYHHHHSLLLSPSRRLLRPGESWRHRVPPATHIGYGQ